jgi:prophage regulatory protein
MPDDSPHIRRMLTERQVLEVVPAARSTLQQWVRDGSFPKPVQIGPARKAWFADEIVDWQRARADTRH